ncbi:MAG: ABC transporter ATP-binding protein [Pedococcus sp.]
MISLSGVSRRYGGRTVLRDVSVTLPEQRIGVIGANGSGKSTFAQLLNGLILPTKGKVTVNGFDTATHGRQVRQQVGFCFTNPDAQIIMPTVAEDVAFSLRRTRLDRAERDNQVMEALARFDLDQLAHQPAHTLSGGLKQLLALASILVLQPAVLVCDEPTTLLDLRHARRVHGILTGLPQQLVLVTHHLELVRDLDRVLVFDKGRLVADGAPQDCVAEYENLMR